MLVLLFNIAEFRVLVFLSCRNSRFCIALFLCSSSDPWESHVYRDNYPFLVALDTVQFRNHSFATGFIRCNEKDELASLGGGKSVHNEMLLMLGKGPGGHKTFRLLVETVRLFGDRYSAVYKELKALLPAAVTGKMTCHETHIESAVITNISSH